MTILRFVLRLLAGLAVALTFLWCMAALWVDGPSPPALAGFLVIIFALAGIAVLVRVRPAWRAFVALLVLIGIVIVWWNRIPASNDRNWMADVARPPWAEIDGNRVTIHNVRNFDYRSETDFTERWETRTFNLDDLRGTDMFFSFWGPTAIAHTIASWEFGDGQHLAISIETRKQVGETYSAVLGFFRQYELYYVVADERDVIGIRTNFRGERVFLYRVRLPAESSRAILLDYLENMNRLAEQPRWYNALTHNCTTTIRDHVKHVMPVRPWGWQLLLNGYLAELWYERGAIDTSIPFAELRDRSDITERAKAAGQDPDFSARIRDALPGRGTNSP